MLLRQTHPEDVKSAIRKRYRSLLAFERAEGLARLSVSEVLRGRKSQRTEVAIERVLREERATESIKSVDSGASTVAHGLNEGAPSGQFAGAR